MIEDRPMPDESGLDISPQDFARLVHGAGDEEIRTVVHGLGTKAVLDRVFEQMVDHFVPEKAKGVDSIIQFVVTDDQAEYPYVVTVREGTCSTAPGSAERPTVTLRMDLVPFLRLAGQARGPVLYMTGKLKVTGNPMVAAGVSSFFEPPQP